MAVRMRLTRVGSKKNPIYRVVVADQRSPRDGRFIEIVGRYNPQTEPSTIELDEERIRNWLSKGAQPSQSVKRLLKAKGMSLPAAHPVEILDASIRGVGLPIGEPDHGQVPAARPPPSSASRAG